MGEHGDSSVVTWSSASIAGESLQRYVEQNDLAWDEEIQKVISDDVKNAAYEIINRKKATYFAIGLAVTRIVEAILRDENTILTVSSLFEGQYGIEDMYLAVPTLVNRQGAVKVIETPLSESEEELLKTSASILKKHLNECHI